MLNLEVQKIFETFFEEDQWRYEKKLDENDEDMTIYDTGMSIESKIGSVDIRIVVETASVCSIARFPIRVGEDRISEINEFITRVNYKYLYRAKLELDYESGQLIAIWYHRTMGEKSFNIQFAEEMFYSTGYVFEDLGDDILEILFGGKTGKEQFEIVKSRIEGDSEVVED